MSTKKQKINSIRSSIKKYERLYKETGDSKYKDLEIKARRKLVSLGGECMDSNNLYTVPHMTYSGRKHGVVTGQLK